MTNTKLDSYIKRLETACAKSEEARANFLAGLEFFLDESANSRDPQFNRYLDRMRQDTDSRDQFYHFVAVHKEHKAASRSFIENCFPALR